MLYDVYARGGRPHEPPGARPVTVAVDSRLIPLLRVGVPLELLVRVLSRSAADKRHARPGRPERARETGSSVPCVVASPPYPSGP